MKTHISVFSLDAPTRCPVGAPEAQKTIKPVMLRIPSTTNLGHCV